MENCSDGFNVPREHTAKLCIPLVLTRTSLYNNYFLPSTVRLWNSEPTSIRDSRFPSSLKSYYKSKCIKKPIYYHSGTRIGQILHMRLRTAFSSLKPSSIPRKCSRFAQL